MQIDDQAIWSLYANFPGAEKPVLLNPLQWRGGDQISNLNEMLKFFKDNNVPDKIKILIYRSMCGSGKSATLLHTIGNMGRGIIVVPFKNLQRQYFDDYYTGENKFILKKDGTRLKVVVMLGRNNFPCKFLHEEYDKQQKLIEAAKKEGHIADINEFILKAYQYDNTCANRQLPCTRPLKNIRRNTREARWVAGSQCPHWVPTPLPKEIIYAWQMKTEGKESIESYYEEDFDYLSSYRKILGLDKDLSISTSSDQIAEKLKKISQLKDLLDKNKLEKNKSDAKCVTRLDRIKERLKCSKIEYYDAVGGEYGIFIRDDVDKDGNKCPEICQYYKQFYSYLDADVIVMNDAKWNIETRIGRKPKVNIEAIDEGDYWLDRQSETIEIKRYIIDKMFPFDSKVRQFKSDTLYIFDTFFNKLKTEVDKQKENIISAKEYRELFTVIAKCFDKYMRYVDDDEKYGERLIELATIIKYIDRASLGYIQGKRDETKIIKVYIPYPDSILKELFERSSKNIIITSGTIQSNYVLANLFGINADNYNVQILDGRKDSPGRLICAKPRDGLIKVTYFSWQSPEFREIYYKKLNYILDNLKIMIDKYTKNPGEAKIIILTPAKKYTEEVINRPDVFVDFAKDKKKGDDTKTMINTNLSDYANNTLEDVRKIKSTDIQLDGDVLRTNQQIIISTRMIRGTDLRDDLCRAIVITKWPTPDVSNGYYQALLKRFGEKIFWAIIKDKAMRDAIQYVCRGLRHDHDWEYFSSPDETAFNNIYRIFGEMKDS